jgi:hypothetical protein
MREASFTNCKFQSIAQLVGLDPLQNLKDIGTFNLHRPRVPTHIFISIVEDIDMLLIQYGPPYEHKTAEATSLFLSGEKPSLIELSYCRK